MIYPTDQSTLDARREFEKAVESAEAVVLTEARARLAHVLMIDYLRGWNGATEENIGLAEKHLKSVYESDLSVALAHVAEGLIREAKGHLRGAIGALNEALKLDPDLAIAYAHKANALILLGQAEKAPELLAKAISSRDPDLGLFYWFMGRAYFNMKKLAPAIWWLKKSVDVKPATWFSWAHLISAYALTGQLRGDDAKAALETYGKNFQANWPLDPKIKEYYNQAKYHDAPPELKDSLKLYLEGLQIAKETSGVP